MRIVAVSKRRRDFSEEFLKDARYYGDTEDMFDKEKMDGVIVLTSPDMHYPAVKMAAKRGIDVFCEKPMDGPYGIRLRKNDRGMRCQ